MIKVGILGFGFMGRTHFSRYQQLENANVVAVADRELERQKGTFLPAGNLDLGLGELNLSAVTIYSAAEELIQDPQVDVVDVCLPTFLHKPFVDLALDHNKDVICEKPLALNASDAFAMVDKAKEKQRKLFVAQVLRFWPEFQFLSNLVQQQKYGSLQYLNFFRRTADPAWTWDDWNLDIDRSGGALDIRIHELDFLYGLLGMPNFLVSQSLDLLSVVQGQFIYQQGPKVFLESNRMLPAALNFEDGFDALFDDAFVRYCGQEKPSLRCFLKSSDKMICPEMDGDPYLEELRCFVDDIDQSKKLSWSSAEDAAHAIRLWEFELESIEEGGVIKPNITRS